VNNIEVLSLVAMDDQLRRAVFRAVYGDSGLSRYSVQAVPSIHIIVKNGNVTLEVWWTTKPIKTLRTFAPTGFPMYFGEEQSRSRRQRQVNLVAATAIFRMLGPHYAARSPHLFAFAERCAAPFLSRFDNARHAGFICLRQCAAAPSAAVTFPMVSKMGAPRHRAPKLFSSSSTAYPDCLTCSSSAMSRVME